MSIADRAPVSDGEADRLFADLLDAPVLIVAVSGGPDSTALLWLMARWRARHAGGPRLVAITVDHGLRAEAAGEARAVKKLADRLGVEHVSLCWRGHKPKTGLQEAARHARYRLFAEAARKAGAVHIVTAHTLDDQAETVLMRMARGSGVGGLVGMGFISRAPIEQGANSDATLFVARPLLSVPKSRLVATLKAAKIPYADDPTNRDPRFTRSRLRALMRALAREGLTAERLSLLADRIAWVEGALHDAVKAAQMKVAPDGWSPGMAVGMAVDAYRELPLEIQLRLLGRVVERKGDEGPVELGKLEALHRDLLVRLSEENAGGGRFRRTLAGAMVTLADNRITVERAPARRHNSPAGRGTGKSARRETRNRDKSGKDSQVSVR